MTDTDDTDDESPSTVLSETPVTSSQLLSVIESSIEDGDVDLARGGVHATTVSDRLERQFGIDREPSTIREYLRQLEADGAIVRVRGLNPNSCTPRTSWLPADHPDLSPSHLPREDS